MKIPQAMLLMSLLLPQFAMAEASAQKREAALEKMEQRFLAADRNRDGKLARDEAQAGMPMVSQRFSEIDAGSKGFVTPDDLRVFLARKVRERGGV